MRGVVNGQGLEDTVGAEQLEPHARPAVDHRFAAVVEAVIAYAVAEPGDVPDRDAVLECLDTPDAPSERRRRRDPGTGNDDRNARKICSISESGRSGCVKDF